MPVGSAPFKDTQAGMPIPRQSMPDSTKQDQQRVIDAQAAQDGRLHEHQLSVTGCGEWPTRFECPDRFDANSVLNF